MKYTDPSEFFKFIIEKSDIEVINDTQRCLALALDLLDSEKPYFRLLKQAFTNNVYKELIKAYNSNSETKFFFINKAIKILTDDCFIKDEKAIETVGWLASIIYPNEWKTFSNLKISYKEDEEIVWEQPKSKPVISIEESNNSKNNIFESKNWTLKDIGLEMVYCPAGSFIMGSPEPIQQKGIFGFIGLTEGGELGRNYDEKQHQIIISKPFMIGKYPVTQKQYLALMKNNPSAFNGDNNPVEYVSCNETKKFLKILNSKYKKYLPDNYCFDLPTEEQWEYACRAGTTTALNSGKNLTSDKDYCCNLDEVGWYDCNSHFTTHPVGQKIPNSWGIYDMHGNVWEWCKNGIIRGGCWSRNAMFCRSASRDSFNPTRRGNFLGFRVAIVPMD